MNYASEMQKVFGKLGDGLPKLKSFDKVLPDLERISLHIEGTKAFKELAPGYMELKKELDTIALREERIYKCYTEFVKQIEKEKGTQKLIITTMVCVPALVYCIKSKDH